MTQSHTMKDLFKRIEALEEYFEGYPNPLRENTLQEIKEKLRGKQTYKIAIVANMSAGKSTLINALFGREILPSFSEATSDCIVEITSMPKIPKKAEVFFENRSPITLEEEDFKELKQYALKDEKCEDEKYKNVKGITLSYPFLNIQNNPKSNIEILFIDTPGLNNTGESGQKHEEQTKTILNEVDMALFAFDYTQLDANLKDINEQETKESKENDADSKGKKNDGNDKLGLWKTIETRKKNDKDFEVFFLLNKIDMALADNKQEMKNDPFYSRDTEKELTKKYWNKHEREAIAKLKKAAEEHGIQIQNPQIQIFPLSSYYELLRRMNNSYQTLTEEEEDELELFKKAFRRNFDDKAEQKLIDYTGFEKLEEAINEYIEKRVSNKILTKYNDKIREIIRKEEDDIHTSIETSKKPKDEALENIRNAEKFLQEELPQIQENTQNAITLNKQEAKRLIESTIKKWIEQEFMSKTKEIVLKSVIFMHEMVDGNKNPRQQVERIFKGNFNKKNYLEAAMFSIKSEEQKNSIQSDSNNYLDSLIQDCKTNFLDIQSEIKNCYAGLNHLCNQALQAFKQDIETRIGKELQIETQEQLEPILIEYSDILTIATSIPKNTLSYEFKEAQYTEVSDSTWWQPWTWGDTKWIQTREEEHYLTINPKELQKAIEESFKNATNLLKEAETKQHQEAIEAFGSETTQKVIEETIESEKQKIARLRKEIQNAEKSLAKCQEQQEKLNKTLKAMKSDSEA